MRKLYLFAAFLVLFEFTAFAANDMIMPGMIQVITQFKASYPNVALSFSFYILGNCALILFTGFFAENYGTRKILIIGNFFFLLFVLGITYSQSINEFMLFRFLQGGTASVVIIGYALIHEKFGDVDAVKLIALMSNISLLAPLTGPLIGSFIASHCSWHTIFYVIAGLSFLSLTGLLAYIPKKSAFSPKLSVNQLARHYLTLLTDKKFCLGSLASSFTMLPIIIWISQAPTIVFFKLSQTYSQYASYQMLSLSGLVIAIFLLRFLVGKYSIAKLIKLGAYLLLIGLACSLLGTSSIWAVCLGLFLYTIGLGLCCSCITRLVMTQTTASEILVATLLGFVETLLLASGSTVANSISSYFDYHLLSFTGCSFGFGLIAYLLINQYVKYYQDYTWD